MSDSVRINGTQIGWQSVTFKLGAEKYTGIKEINYGDKRERGFAYGLGKHGGPRGKGPGKYDPGKIEITGWKTTIQAIKKDLAALASDGASYGNVSVPMVLSFVEADDGTVVVEADACTVEENAASHAEGTDPLEGKITLLPMRIRENGLSLYDATIPGSGAT